MDKELKIEIDTLKEQIEASEERMIKKLDERDVYLKKWIERARILILPIITGVIVSIICDILH